jgi:hypothetical protein
MGGTSYSARDWDSYKTTASTKTNDAIFTNKSGLHKDLDPKNIVVREARDSAVNPITTPVLAGIDLTGSMGSLSRQIVTKGLGQIFEELLSRKVVPGPQFAFAGFGDVLMDRDAWFQLSQFESDTASLTPQLEKMYRVGEGGGANDSESNGLVWYAALTRVVHDAYSVRGKKGYLFTVGDEEVPPNLTPADIVRAFGGDTPQSVPTNEQLLAALSQQWEVFHIMVEQGNHMRGAHQAVIRSWTDLIGQRAILLADVDNLSEVMISCIEVCEGRNVDDVAKSWSGDTSLVVAKAISGLNGLATRPGDSGAVQRF